MEDTQSVAVLLDSATSKIQQLQRAFAELQSHRAVTLNMKWKELEAHFHGLEKSLKRRFHELEDQEKVYETKTVEVQEMLEKRKEAVVAKEEECLEKLQEKRDSAVFALSKAREKHRKVLLPVEEKSPDIMVSEEVSSEDAKSSVVDGSLEVNACEEGSVEVTSSPQLVKLSQNMDSDGLHSYISDNRKNLATIREEIPLALRVSPDPASLVLDSLINFYRGDLSSLDAKKDSGLLGLRRTCIMLLECLSILLTSLDSVTVSNIVSEEVKARAKVVAAEWKPKLGELELDMSNGNSLEAHAFLQLLDTFCIASDFDAEELSKLVPLVSRRRQVADLCRSLGLCDRMPGVIQVLINSGRQIDAVNLAFAFELTEQFSPVVLLKSYIKEASKAVYPKPGNVSPGHGSPSSLTAQIEVSERELAALKAVIKCVEEHKLEDQYPLDPLQKRVIQLEKAKAEKKRANEVSKPQPKRPRASNPGNGPGPRIANTVADRSPPYAMQAPERYAPPPQYVFDSRPYAYTADTHCTPLFAPAAYGLPPAHQPHGHNNYFSNGYQYHHQAYLH